MDAIQCENPSVCRLLAEHKQREWEQHVPAVLKIYDSFLDSSRHAVFASMHGIKRMQERKINPRDVRDVIECCAPIAYQFAHIPHYFPPKVHLFIISGERADGRPLHVVCSLPPDPPVSDRWILRIRSVYDPSTQPFEWSRDYTQRLCFCYGAARRQLHQFEETLQTTVPGEN